MYFYLIDCVFGFHLYIHGHKKGEEEQNSTRKSHQFAGRKFSIWTNSWLNVTILKLKSKLKSERKFCCRYLFDTDDCDDGTGDHYGNGRHEHRVQDFVFAWAGGHQPVTDLEKFSHYQSNINCKTYHKLFVSNILVLTELTSGRVGILLWRNFQPFLKKNYYEFTKLQVIKTGFLIDRFLETGTSKIKPTLRQGLWTYRMEPRQRHGERRGLLGSILGSWHILQIGIDVVEDECDMETGMQTPLRRLAWKQCFVTQPTSFEQLDCSN